MNIMIISGINLIKENLTIKEASPFQKNHSSILILQQLTGPPESFPTIGWDQEGMGNIEIGSPNMHIFYSTIIPSMLAHKEVKLLHCILPHYLQLSLGHKSICFYNLTIGPLLIFFPSILINMRSSQIWALPPLVHMAGAISLHRPVPNGVLEALQQYSLMATILCFLPVQVTWICLKEGRRDHGSF